MHFTTVGQINTTVEQKLSNDWILVCAMSNHPTIEDTLFKCQTLTKHCPKIFEL